MFGLLVVTGDRDGNFLDLLRSLEGVGRGEDGVRFLEVAAFGMGEKDEKKKRERGRTRLGSIRRVDGTEQTTVLTSTQKRYQVIFKTVSQAMKMRENLHLMS